MLDGYMTTKEAASVLGLQPKAGRVQKLVREGQLDGEKIGNTLLVTVESVERRKNSGYSRKGGRPKKRATERNGQET
jgi:excisionase family DNA binding protein